MDATLVAGSIVRPRFRRAGRVVEGPDEDAFTLAVAAAEELLDARPSGSPPLGRIDLVGPFEVGVDHDIGIALGTEIVETHHHPSGVEGLFQALVASQHAADGGAESVVIAVDVVGPDASKNPGAGAAAAAVRFGRVPGATVARHSSRSHPPDRRPVAAEWIAAALRAFAPTTESSVGVLEVVATAPPPVLLAEWVRARPGIRASVHPWATADGGDELPSVRGILAVRDALAAAKTGEAIGIAAIRSDRTDFLGLTAGTPPTWSGEQGTPGAGREGPPAPPTVRIDARSEGAYVPWARYQENLPSRWRFAADRCAHCGSVTFPPRGVCRSCGATDRLESTSLPRRGLTVVAATAVASGAQPSEFDFQVEATGPYPVVIAAWPDGARVTLQVADAEPGVVRIGDRIDTRLRRLYPMEGHWRYGRKAVPATPSA